MHRIANDNRPGPKAPRGEPYRPHLDTFVKMIEIGHALDAVLEDTGISRHCYDKWHARYKPFRDAVDAARMRYRAHVKDGFHDAENYARGFLDRLMRDEYAPLALRFKVATAFLNREPGSWLPPIPLPPPADDSDNAAETDPADTDEPESSASPEGGPASPQEESDNGVLLSQSTPAAAPTAAATLAPAATSGHPRRCQPDTDKPKTADSGQTSRQQSLNPEVVPPGCTEISSTHTDKTTRAPSNAQAKATGIHEPSSMTVERIPPA